MAQHEPFARFLTARPCPPLEGVPPATNCVGLFELATRRMPRTKAGYTSPFVLAKVYQERDYWIRRCKVDPLLREWVLSPQAFYSPDRWPPEVEGVLPSWVTPLIFSAHMTPSAAAPFRTPILRVAGIEELCAFATGWPVSSSQYVRMAHAAADLMDLPTFVIWAFDLHLDGIPLPFSTASITVRLTARTLLETNPLGCGNGHLYRALPKSMRNPHQLLRQCPRRSGGVGSSRRRPTISNFEELSLPSHLTPAGV